MYYSVQHACTQYKVCIVHHVRVFAHTSDAITATVTVTNTIAVTALCYTFITVWHSRC
jgi:hypothetical protein